MIKKNDFVVEQILAAREYRTLVLKNNLVSGMIGVTLTLNIPGVNKTPLGSTNFFQAHYQEVKKFLNQEFIIQQSFAWLDQAGLIGCFFLKNADPYLVKKALLVYEERIGQVGKLLDLDVYLSLNCKISRTDVGQTPRQCFLCFQPAKLCRLEQRHPLTDLEQFVHQQLMTNLEPIIKPSTDWLGTIKAETLGGSNE